MAHIAISKPQGSLNHCVA